MSTQLNESGLWPRRDSAVELDDFAEDLEAGGVKILRRKDQARALFVPQVRWERIAAAAYDKHGKALASTPGFPIIDAKELVDRVGGQTAAIVTGVQSVGGQSLVAIAAATTARAWQLPEAARAILDAPGATLAAVSTAHVRSSDAVLEACAHLGLSPLQSRVIVSLARHGDLERGAAENGIAYSTAREALAAAMERTSTKRRSAMIDRIVTLSFGVLPEGRQGHDLLRDTWGLSARQAALATAVAQGASREEAACSVGVSAATAKKELANIFISLGVSNATELSALISEATALETLLLVTRGGMAVTADHSEPLRFVPRPGGGMIAFSDYGPREGKPVLVLHSSSASRPAPTKLVSALQERGFRPFAIDRPGFGLTDPIAHSDDPFVTACADIEAVCSHLRLKRIDIVARGAAQVAMHLAARAPALIDRVVLVAPDPSSRNSKPGWGVLGTIKIAFRSNPTLIEPLARMVVATLTASNVRDLVLKTVRNSPPDVAVMKDPRNLADYCRGFQMFLSGRIGGYVREQAALVLAPDPPAHHDARSWHVLIGEHDPLHDPADVESYWRRLLPNAHFRLLPDAGRFVVMSHARLIAQLLSEAIP